MNTENRNHRRPRVVNAKPQIDLAATVTVPPITWTFTAPILPSLHPASGPNTSDIRASLVIQLSYRWT
jgi:hypothetical protein